MNLSQAVDVMQETPLFRRLDPKRLRVVAMMGETQSYRPGERLFEAGEEGESAFVILGGQADVLIRVDGEDREVAVLSQGEIFGEIAALTEQPRTTAIRARGDLTVLRLERQTILNLMKEFPDIALELITILANRLRDTSSELARRRQSR